MSELSLSKDKIKITLLEGVHARAEEVFRSAGYNNLQLLPKSLTGDALLNTIKDTHFIGIRSRTQLDDAVLHAAPKLAVIGCFCIGTNQVELDTAQDLGIPVFNAPFSNTRSVAELVLAETVMLMRGIPARNAAAHRGQWLKNAAGSFEIRGKTLGIVGYGHIGTQLGVLAESLGMRVIFHDIEEKLPLGNAAAKSALTQLLKESDVVSLHVPQTIQTAQLIDKKAIAAMKPNSILINASRGNVVDIEALCQALDQKHLTGAAIDVFPSEPKSNQEEFMSPLRGRDNVILTPHIGGSTAEAQQNIAAEVAQKMVRYSDNGTTVSSVNFPEASIPDHVGRRRLLHIHRNEPGVMQAINRIFSEQGVNIASQYLQTRGRIGYVVMDLETDAPEALMQKMKVVPGTIRTRILYSGNPES